MNPADYLKMATDSCLAELTTTPLKHVANAYINTEAVIFKKKRSGLNQFQPSPLIDVVSIHVSHNEMIDFAHQTNPLSRMMVGNYEKLDLLDLQSGVGYIWAAAKVAESQSDNPVCYAANPTNYASIRRGIFEHESDALAFSKLQRDVDVFLVHSMPTLMEGVTSQLMGTDIPFDEICREMEKNYELDTRIIGEIYRCDQATFQEGRTW